MRWEGLGGGGVNDRGGTKHRISSTAAESCTVITANQGVRGGRSIELKQTVDAAVSSCPQVRNVLVAMRTAAPVQLGDKDVAMEEVCGRGLLGSGPTDLTSLG